MGPRQSPPSAAKPAAKVSGRSGSQGTWGAGAGRAPRPAPGQGAPPWRRVLPLLIAFLVGTLLAGPGWALVTRDDGRSSSATSEPEPEPGSVEAVAAQLRQQEAARNRAETARVTDIARAVHDDVVPVLDAMGAALPPAEGTPPRPAAADTVAGWRTEVDQAVGRFGNTPSAATSVTLAHSGLQASVGDLQSAVTAYEVARDADGSQRATLTRLAAELRDRAVDVWSLAAVQLDEANIEYGSGHIHLYLSPDGAGGAAEGGAEPDGHIEPDGGGLR